MINVAMNNNNFNITNSRKILRVYSKNFVYMIVQLYTINAMTIA